MIIGKLGENFHLWPLDFKGDGENGDEKHEDEAGADVREDDGARDGCHGDGLEGIIVMWNCKGAYGIPGGRVEGLSDRLEVAEPAVESRHYHDTDGALKRV